MQNVGRRVHNSGLGQPSACAEPILGPTQQGVLALGNSSSSSSSSRSCLMAAGVAAGAAAGAAAAAADATAAEVVRLVPAKKAEPNYKSLDYAHASAASSAKAAAVLGYQGPLLVPAQHPDAGGTGQSAGQPVAAVILSRPMTLGDLNLGDLNLGDLNHPVTQGGPTTESLGPRWSLAAEQPRQQVDRQPQPFSAPYARAVRTGPGTRFLPTKDDLQLLETVLAAEQS